MRSGDNTDDITTKLLELFLENYEKEENILRSGSNYVFDCVDSALVFFHTVKLKRGSYTSAVRNGYRIKKQPSTHKIEKTTVVLLHIQ